MGSGSLSGLTNKVSLVSFTYLLCISNNNPHFVDEQEGPPVTYAHCIANTAVVVVVVVGVHARPAVSWTTYLPPDDSTIPMCVGCAGTIPIS